MADAPPPDDRTARSGEEPEAPSQANRPAHAGGFTLDLSSGPASGQPEAWRRKRKQASPVLTKIVDLSTPKPAPTSAAPPAGRPEPAAKPPSPRTEPRSKRKDGARRSSGATLADLLDEATLARLRGGE